MKKIIKNNCLKYYLNKHQFGVSFYVILNVLACLLSGLETILFSKFLAVTISSTLTKSVRYLVFAGVSLLIQRACWWLSYCIYVRTTNIMWTEIAKDLTERSFKLSSSTFVENGSGEFIQHIMEDPHNAVDQLSSLVENFAQIATGFFVMFYIVYLNWIIGLIYITLVLALFVMEFYRKKVYAKNKIKTKSVNDKAYSLVGEIIKSENDIKALNLEHKLHNTTSEYFNNLKKVKNKESITDIHFWNGRCLILEFFGTLVLGLGLYLMQKELLTIATFILIFSYRNNMYELVWYGGNIAKCFADVKVSVTRMFSMYDEELYPAEKFGNKTLTSITGKIEFNNVEFAYTELKETENTNKYSKKRKQIERIRKEPIFEKLSFKIEPNTTVAFVGKSGSGKSTILSLITKLNDIDNGEILIDNINIQDISKISLRNNISLINQFPYIFDMTIRDNLLLVKKDATDEEIWEVLKRASLDNDIASMPKGLDTKVGETGLKLSGGQRQRLAIARALLKQTKIILFDESTSSLDNFAQSKIQHSIDNMKGQHTIVIVAHRLSTIKNVDKIYFLDNGKIVASGTFDELFETNKTFKAMFLAENI